MRFTGQFLLGVLLAVCACVWLTGMRWHGFLAIEVPVGYASRPGMPLASRRLEDLTSIPSPPIVEVDLQSALKRHASADDVIIVAYADSGYIDMALNLYHTSLEAHKLSNYLFVASDARVCPLLLRHHVNCFYFAQDPDAGKASNYHSAVYRRKTHFKTQIVLVALRTGLTVLLTDVDIVFLKNPFEHFKCPKCDLQIQNDGNEVNSGFYLVRPSKAAITLLARAWDVHRKRPELYDQATLARTFENMTARHEILSQILPDDLFPNGLVFFEKGKRMFAGDKPCPKCVIVHNNWIVSVAAKAYRFKEYGMWEVDKDGYYSDANRKYLTYENPDVYGNASMREMEGDALKVALLLGASLNRAVILPTFSCHGCEKGPCLNKAKRCSMSTFYLMTKFDAQFSGSYREHLFPQHHKVPESVRTNVSRILAVASTTTREVDGAVEDRTPGEGIFSWERQSSSGSLLIQLTSWLKKYQGVAVLRFKHLYNLWVQLKKDDSMVEMVHKIDGSLVKGAFRQYQNG